MLDDLNPYAPARGTPVATPDDSHGFRVRLRGIVASFATGFIGGTALQWAVLWTDGRSMEFPPMGGAFLGLTLAAALRYRVATSRSGYLVAGMILGNANAYWCNPDPINRLIRFFSGGYLALQPQNLLSAWGRAGMAFFAALLLTGAIAALCGRLMIRVGAVLRREADA